MFLKTVFCIILFTGFIQAGSLKSVYTNLNRDIPFTPVDVDDDGDLDLLAGSNLYYQNDDGSFDGPYTFIAPSRNLSELSGAGIRKENETPLVFRFQRSASDGFYNLVSYPHGEYGQISTQQVEETYSTPPSVIIMVDIDNDGYLDILAEKVIDASTTPYDVTTLTLSWGNSSSNNEITIANFLENSEFYSPVYFYDLDHNGLIDIIYSGVSDGESSLHVIHQSSLRTFDSPMPLSFTDGTIIRAAFDFADLNGDGRMDLYRLDERANEFIYVLQTAAGGFSLPVSIQHGETPHRLIGVDESAGRDAVIYYLNQRVSDQDVALTSFIFDRTESTETINLESVLTNDTTSLYKSDSARSFSLLLDINQDGYKDIILSLGWEEKSRGYLNSTVTVSRPQLCIGYGTAEGSFDFRWQGNPPINGKTQLSSDFNGDGYPDFIVGMTPKGNVCLIINDEGNGWVSKRELTELLPESFRIQDVHINTISAVDINNDGYFDLHVQLRKPQQTSSTGEFIGVIGVVGFELDNRDDVIYYENDKNTYHYLMAINDGSGHFAYSTSLPDEFIDGTVDQPYPIFAYADWDNDGDLDAFTTAFGWYENVDGVFSTSMHFLVSPGTATDAVGYPVTVVGTPSIVDIDGDGALDFVAPISGIAKSNNLVYPPISGKSKMTIVYGNGDGGISEIVSYPLSLLTTDALGYPRVLSYNFLDLNDDGRKDIIYNEFMSDALGNPFAIPFMAYNSPNGRFGQLNTFNAKNGLYGTILADYNGDGSVDICGLNGFTSASTYGAVTSPQYNFLSPYQIYSGLVLRTLMDIDNDHDSDFLFETGGSASPLFSFKNPLVDGDDPVVRYALDAGLMADQANPNADPDGDGLTNLVEYMFGGQATSIDSSGILPRLGTDLQLSQPKLTASFKRRIQLPEGKQYHLRISEDLHTWIDYPLDEGTTTPINNAWQQFSIAIDPASIFPNGTQAFIQWDVE